MEVNSPRPTPTKMRPAPKLAPKRQGVITSDHLLSDSEKQYRRKRMSNKMSDQVPSIEMFEALVATVNNLSAQLAHTKKSMLSLQASFDSLSINGDINRNLLRTDISNNSRISNAKIPDYGRVSNASIPGLDPWRNHHGQ